MAGSKITTEAFEQWMADNYPEVTQEQLDEEYEDFWSAACDSLLYEADPYAYNGLSRSDFY